MPIGINQKSAKASGEMLAVNQKSPAPDQRVVERFSELLNGNALPASKRLPQLAGNLHKTQPSANPSLIDPLINAEPNKVVRMAAAIQTPSFQIAQTTQATEAAKSPAAEIAGAVGGTPAIFTRPEAIARHEMARFIEQIQSDIAAGRLSKTKAGPVGAVVVDNITGHAFTGRNTGLPERLHPVLSKRLENMDAARMHNSKQGTHAEINALNNALWNREAHNQARGNNRLVTEPALSTMTQVTAWTKTSEVGGMVQGESAPRCANCVQITDGVHNLAGDATKPYNADKASSAGIDPAQAPRSHYQEANIQSLRRGALVGSIAGAGVSTARALEDGRITGNEVTGIVADAGLGAATAAAGDIIEHTVARALDRASGQAIQQSTGATTRVMSSRLAGAGAAGAIIGAGFSSVGQIKAYQRGEITASQAIGTVTAEAATGLAAGAAGAAAGAAIGSVIPVAGTIIGGIIGFSVGMVAGFLADHGLRTAGVTNAIAGGITSAIDAGSNLVNDITDTLSGWGNSLSSAFGW